MRWKWIPIIAAATVVIVVVAAYTILSGYDFNKFKPRIEQAAYEATGRTLTLGGDIGLKIGLTPTLVVEDVSLQNAKWGSRPSAVTIERFEVKVALLPLLRGNIDVKRLILIRPDILVETNRRGRSNLSFTPPEKEATESKGAKEAATGTEPALPALMVGELLIQDATLTYKDASSGKGTSVRLKRASAIGLGAKGAVAIDIKGSLDDTPFNVSGRIDSITGLTDPSGGPLRLSDLKIRFGQNSVTGTVEVDRTAPRPRLTGSLYSSSIDLGGLSKNEKRAKTKQPGKKRAKVKNEKVFSDDPLPVKSLKAVDLDLNLKVDRFSLPPLVLNDISAKISLKNGRLKLAPLKAGAGGGTLGAKVDIRLRGKAAALDAQIDIDRLDLGVLGTELKIAKLLNGTVDATVRVRGKGASVAALMSTLDGELKVVMGMGRIDNGLLKFAGGDLGSNVLRLLNPLAAKENDTVVNCMVAGFDIEKGVARSSALIFDTSYMSIVGNGKIDLKTERLDISLKPIPKKGLGTDGVGKLTLSLGELARPFKLGGTLANPGLAIDTTQTVLSIGKIIGGKALLGPAGIATALLGTNGADENRCLSAIEAQKKGVSAKPVKREKKKSESSVPPIPAEIKDVGEGLLKLFGQ